MTKTLINPAGFTQTAGSYSHGVKVEVGTAEMIFVTGQTAMNEHGQVVSDNLTDQTEFIFQNIQKILHEGGLGLDDIVKVTIFMTHLHPSTFAEVSEVRNKYLSNARAASTLVGVSKLVRDQCQIEIDAIAIKKKT